MNKKEKQFSSSQQSHRTNNKTTNEINPADIAFHNADEILVLVNTDLIVTATTGTHNPKTINFLGAPLQPGTCILDLVPASEQAGLQELYRKVFSGERLTQVVEMNSGGTTLYQRFRYKPAYQKNGTLAGALVTIDDYTAIRKRELGLQLSEERWRFALEGSNQGLWDWNVQTGEVFFSVSWKKLFGYTDEDVFNNISQWQKRIHPQDRKMMAANMRSHLNNENPLFESIYRFMAKNGEYRWLLSRGITLDKDETGKAQRMIGTHTDITDIRLLQENYKTLFDSNPLASWTYNLDAGRFLEVNKAALQLYGYTKTEFLNLHMVQLFADGSKWQKENKAFFKASHYQQHRKKNGELITVNITAHVLDKNHANIALMLAEDVTQKAAAEETLISSNERFNLASKATSDAIYDWDITTGQLSWGEGLYNLFGYHSHELTLKNWETFMYPGDQEEVVKSLFSTINHPNKKNWTKEYRLKTAKGEYRYVIEKGFILRDKTKKAIRMIGALQDITEIKQKQIELEKSNARFDAILKSTSEFIWDWDLENNTFYRDPYGLKKVLGVMNENSVMNETEWLSRLHPDDRQEAQQVIDKILNGTIGHAFEREYRFKRDDGTYAYIHDRGIAIRNKEGKPVRLIGAAQNITLRRKLEGELLQKELEKQKIISKATIDAQEQERSEIGRELHDNVNQVLTTTKLYLELAQARPEMKEEMIQKSSNSILYVINEIRQLSRSLMNPSIGDLGLVDAIKDLIDSINSTKKLAVKLESTQSIEELLTADLKLMVYRILQEALNNAIRHSRAKNVLICIKKKEKIMEMIVQDDGIGFNIAAVKKGIGLKNIENRIYLINGRLQVVTAPGQGCKLIVHFPFIKSNANPT